MTEIKRPTELNKIHTTLLRWYLREGRNLPWRRTKDPYFILLSEVMLQQTQVQRVVPKFEEFREKFPSFKSLAAASISEIIRAWSPLGYNRRAVWLQSIASEIAHHYGGRLPKTEKELRRMPGIGEYTASALACFIHGKTVPVIDTNVTRVLWRIFSGGGPTSRNQTRQLALWALPQKHSASWNQALMDLGATVCTAHQPACTQCPLKRFCRSAPLFEKQPSLAKNHTRRVGSPGRFTGSSRFFRGRIVEHLRRLAPGVTIELSQLGIAIRNDYSDTYQDWLLALLKGLERDGLARIQESPAPNKLVTNLFVSLP